jgi:N-acetylglucosamine-6-phosphate deacetylase
MTSNCDARLEGSILTPSGWIEGALTIAGANIAAIEGRAPAPTERPSGPFILPGFIDLHVHGGGGADWQGGEAGIRGLVRYHTS